LALAELRSIQLHGRKSGCTEVQNMSDILFTNANVLLEGCTNLQTSLNVLVEGNSIKVVSSNPVHHPAGRIIDVAGRTVMPGLIDAHAHITGLSLSPKNISYSASEITSAASSYLRNCLMNGFTTIREAGGADYQIARLMADGSIIGPRLFYSGKALTQTGGGADFRTPSEHIDPCGHVSPFSVMSVIADGVDEVRKAAREELRQGATQLKLFASGGVVFPSESHSTLYEFSEAELNAAVEEAAARGTYVMAHVYTDEGVRRCLKAGVRSIEHANFVNEKTVAMMAEYGAYFDPTFISLVQRIESANETRLSASIVDNIRRTVAKGKQVYAWAKNYNVPIAFGTDLWGLEAQKSQLREFEMRMELDSAANVIHSATAVNADLLMQTGKLEAISPGACADLLIVEDNPLEDLRLMTRPENFKLIMKDGVVYKNELA
jgi:imidazolonepropionase-like amidohydrolase